MAVLAAAVPMALVSGALLQYVALASLWWVLTADAAGRLDLTHQAVVRRKYLPSGMR